MNVAERFEKPAQANRILLIQLGDIGDVVWSLPALCAVRRTWPASEVSVLLREGNGSLFAADVQPTKVFEVQKGFGRSLRLIRSLRKERFDLAFDFRGDERGAYMAFLTGAPVRAAIHLAMLHGMRNRLFTHLVAPTGLPLAGVGAADSSLYLLRAFGIEAESAIPELRLSAEVRLRVTRIIAEEGVEAAIDYGLEKERPDRESPLQDVPQMVLAQVGKGGPSNAFDEKQTSASSMAEKRNERGGWGWVTVNPFSRWTYKEWAVEKWVQVLDWLWSDFGIATVIVGAPAERERADELARGCTGRIYNLAGKTTLGELAGLLEQSRLHIGVDSAAPHIAGAVGTPTVTLYGPSDWRYWKPPGDKHRVVVSAMDCVPCHQKGCEGRGVSRCLDTLEIGAVQKAVRETLSR